MYILNNELKSKLGILIDYYRDSYYAKTKDSDFLLSNFILNEDGSYICSDKTYKRIREGYASTKDEIYDALLNKLGQTFAMLTCKNIEQLERNYSALLSAVERYDELQIDQITSDCLQILDSYKNCFYYKDLIEIIHLVREFYLDSLMMSEDQYNKYLLLFKIFDDSLQIIIKELLYRYCHFTYREVTKLNELSLIIDLDSQSNVLMKTNQIYQLIFNQNSFEAYEMGVELIQYLLQERNYNQLISIYTILIAICNNFNAKQAEDYFNQIEEILNLYSEKISKKKQGKIYSTLGMQYYSKNDLHKAYEYLCKSVCLDASCFQESGIFIQHIQYITEVELYNLPQFDLSQYSNRFQTLYHYFEIKEKLVKKSFFSKKLTHEKKESLRVLEHYIIDEVLPILTKGEDLLIDLYQQEIDWLAGQSFIYSNAQKYRVYFKKLKVK